MSSNLLFEFHISNSVSCMLGDKQLVLLLHVSLRLQNTAQHSFALDLLNLFWMIRFWRRLLPNPSAVKVLLVEAAFCSIQALWGA